MNVQLYEPDCELEITNDDMGFPMDLVSKPFMRPSPFGSYVKLEDYEELEKAYESLLAEQHSAESKLEDDLQEAEEAAGYWENLYYGAKHKLDNIEDGVCD